MDEEWRSTEPDSSQPDQKSDEQYSSFDDHEIGSATGAEDLAEYVLRTLAPGDEDFEVSRELLTPDHVKLTAKCAQVNTGRLIGRGGKTINALRTLARAIAQRHGKRIDIEILTDE